MRRTWGRPHVVVVSDAIAPFHHGGKETRYRELVSRAQTYGVDVTVATMNWWGGKDFTQDGVHYRSITPCFSLYNDTRRSIFQAILFSLGCLRLIRWPMNVIEADHMPYLQLFPLWVVSRVRRVPLVVTWHEVWGRDYWVDYAGAITGRVGAVIERLAARLPDRIVAVSETTRERLVALGVDPDSVQVVPAGIDTATLDDVEAHPDGADIIFVGRLMDHKRVDVALCALADLATRGLSVELDIVGDGPERDRLVGLARSLGIEHQVRFLGSLDEHADVWSRIKAARAVAFPSEREGFGILVAEALSAGVPVVCSDHPHNESRHLVDDGLTGAVVAAGEAEAFADAIAHWLEREVNADEVREAFSASNPHLSWDHLAERYANLYREVA